METVRKVAIMCVTRAAMFGTLAIGCVMFSLSFSPPAALRCGAILALLMSGILLFKAHHVLHQKPRDTEVWLYLDERTRPHDAETGRRYANVLREVYGRAARITLVVACGMFVTSTLLVAAGMEMQGFQAAMR